MWTVAEVHVFSQTGSMIHPLIKSLNSRKQLQGSRAALSFFFTLFESQSGKILQGLVKQREEWQGLRKTNRDALLSALRQGRMNR